MATEKKYIMLRNVHHASKKSKERDEGGRPIDGDMTKLEKGSVCPPHLVEEMLAGGHAAAVGTPEAVLAAPNFHSEAGVAVGEAGDVGFAKDKAKEDKAAEEKDNAGAYPNARGQRK